VTVRERTGHGERGSAPGNTAGQGVLALTMGCLPHVRPGGVFHNSEQCRCVRFEAFMQQEERIQDCAVAVTAGVPGFTGLLSGNCKVDYSQ